MKSLLFVASWFVWLAWVGGGAVAVRGADVAGVMREVYSDIGGSALSDLTNNPAFPSRPSLEEIRPDFEAPADWSDNYGQRLRALVVPPVTGRYLFWISSDDQGALFLGTDETPASKRVIAWVNSWTASREWTKEVKQQSAFQTLQAGRRYYIEALQKEGGGGDNLAVRWQLPDGTTVEPIPGSNLVVVGMSPPVVTRAPTNTTVVEGGFAGFRVAVERYLGIGFQWYRGSTALAGETNAELAVGPVAIADEGARFSVAITNSQGSVTTAPARLTVARDITPPSPVSVVSLVDPRRLTVLFSEPVEAGSVSVADHFTLDRGVTVVAARPGLDARAVVLETSVPLGDGEYVLAVRDVRDRASQPNTVAAGTRIGFSLGFDPLDITRLDGLTESAGPSNRRGQVGVSELHPHPGPRSDGRQLEFVELFNPNPWPESIAGWRLSGDVEFRFPADTVVAATGYLVIAAVPADVETVYGISGVLGYAGRLGGGSGTVRLRNESDAVVWETTYHAGAPWPVAFDGAGHSLVLARPSLGEKDPRAWRASATIGGTPGRAESWSDPRIRTVRINEFLAHTDDPQKDFVELYNYGAAEVVLDDCALTDDARTNRFVIPADTRIAPGGFVVFDHDRLGFALSAAGETLLLREASTGRVLDAVRYGDQANGVSTGRTPDGAPEWSVLASPTPGSPNTGRRESEVVLNEVMYEPADGGADGEFVELWNRGSTPVALGGWRLTGAVEFTFPDTATLRPNAYLVVARRADVLRARYAGLDESRCYGDYSGSLGNGGESLRLTRPDPLVATNAMGHVTTNTLALVVDEVAYRAGGRWPARAAGGGSSLERLDPRVDGRLAAAWVASDESTRSGWVTVETTGTLDLGMVTPASLEAMLLGPGECLLDDVEVILGAGTNRVPNGDFSKGLQSWVPQGNQSHSVASGEGGTGGSPCLRLIATGRGDTANRVRVRLGSVLPTNQRATIRARARWLSGASQILLRIHGAWLEATTNILTTLALGTPAAPNRTVANAAPSITDVLHQPVLPAARQAVTVSARVADPDGLASLMLRYRIDPATNWTAVGMSRRGAGYFTGVIPGQPAGALAAFYVEAADGAVEPAIARFPADAPAREALVRWGEPTASAAFAAYRFWITQRNIDAWKRQAKLGNDLTDVTFVLGRDRVIYNAGARYSGSPYHAPSYDSPVGNYCDYQITLPEDDVLLGDTDLNLLQPGNGCCEGTLVREQFSYAIARRMGMPFNLTRHVHVFANGQRRTPMLMLDSQQANGEFTRQWWPDADGGDLHKIALWFEFNDAETSFDATGASFGNFTSGGTKKLARYRWNWPRRAAQHDINNYTNLYALHDAMLSTGTGDTYTRRMEAVLDPANWARTVAMEHIIGNTDSFAYGGGQNMFVFKPAGGRWTWLLWDIDFAFQADSPTSTVFSFGGAELTRLLRHPPFYRHYYRALRDAAAGPLSTAFMNPYLDSRYNAFRAAGFSPESPSSIKTFVNSRRAYLERELARVNVPFQVLDPVDITASVNPVTLRGVAPIGVVDILVDGVSWPVSWIGLTNWTLRLPLAPGHRTLVVQGRDDRLGLIGGTTNRVTVDFQGPADPALGTVFINEWMADNEGSLRDPADGKSEDWIELFNAGPAGVALAGYYLANSETNRTQWRFPDDAVIPPGGFRLVWADGQTNQTTTADWHTSFKLDRAGETIALFGPNGLPIDRVEFGPMAADAAAGRYPDGWEGTARLLRPTPGQPNAPRAAGGGPQLQVETDPAGGLIHLLWDAVEGLRYRVERTDALGSGTWELVEALVATGPSAALSLDLGTAPARFYRVVAE